MGRDEAVKIGVPVLGLLLLAACAGGSSSLPRSSPSVAPLSPPPATSDGASGTLAVGDCPIDDRRFCQEASALANALTQSSGDAVFTLSRPDRFDCAELDPDLFPQCEELEVLRGYAIGGYRGELSIVPAADYRGALEFFVEAIDEDYSDELGGGGMRIVGISTCGSNDADRSYHLVYTAGLDDPDDPFAGTRFLGTYEFARRDRGWAIAVAYFGLYTDWQLVFDDPLSQIACGGIQPWG